MSLQQFGNIQTPDGVFNSMICIDEDRPHEAVIHWWKPKLVDAQAALLRLNWHSSDEAEILPITLYAPRKENGEIWAPALSDEQRAEFLGHRGTLKRLKNGSLRGEWAHTNGTRGKLTYAAGSSNDERVDATKCETWEDFKRWANKSRNSVDACLFRGHGSSNFRLSTTLHRAGRNRIERYCSETLVQFRSHAEAVLGMRFDPQNKDDYSVLLGLAQHHGLPTPLLDWSSSPYIAAFFAFSDAMELGATRPGTSHVRVYGLARKFVAASAPSVVTLPFIAPYACTLSISARHNPRLYAQQGQFLVTNVSDVERYLCVMQKEMEVPALIAADIPVSFARSALEDLSFMGLTAATMFPGLDGVCRMMKHEMSFKKPLSSANPKPGGRPSLTEE